MRSSDIGYYLSKKVNRASPKREQLAGSSPPGSGRRRFRLACAVPVLQGYGTVLAAWNARICIPPMASHIVATSARATGRPASSITRPDTFRVSPPAAGTPSASPISYTEMTHLVNIAVTPFDQAGNDPLTNVADHCNPGQS